MSLMGDAMSHAILPGAALGYLAFGLSLGAMTVGGILAGLLVALLAGVVARSSVLKEDASLAAFYLLALDVGSLLLIAAIASLTLAALAVMLRPLVAECFDRAFLRGVSGWSPVVHYSFLVLVVLNLVSGFHALGTLMAVGIMILPAAAARLWVRRLGPMLGLASGLAFASGVGGLLISFHGDVPAGPAIILVAGLFYFAALLFAPGGPLTRRLFGHTHLES